MRHPERCKNARRFLLVSGLALTLAACGGSGGTPDPIGGTGTTEGGSTQPTTNGTSTPDTTQVSPSGTDEGSIVVEFLDTSHEFSVAEDIEVVPGSNYPTRCEPNSFDNMFWVVATAVDDQGQMVSDYQAEFSLFPDGTVRQDAQNRVTLPGDGSGLIRYSLDLDDPGSWTISGNRASGELNLTYFGPEGTEESTTATFEFVCPSS